MINPEKPFDIRDYVEILLRRKWYLIIPFFVILTGTVIYALYSPKEYRATALILVTPQKVPEQFIRPTVTSKIEDRLQSISQEIMSRTRLEQVISEFKLYSEEMKNKSLEQVVELMRSNIEVEIKAKEGYFTTSYMGRDPRTVTLVTNKLASLFIEENLKYREQQAQGTTEFLASERNATKVKLEEQEKEITKFKSQHAGELPEQRDANIRVFEQIQNLYQRTNENIRSAQDRRVVIQKQLADIDLMIASLSSRIEGTARESRERKETKEEISPDTMAWLLNPGNPPNAPVPGPQARPRAVAKDPQEAQLERMKNLLIDLRGKYTEKHPDIMMTKKNIADLEVSVEKTRQERAIEEKKQEEKREAEQKELEKNQPEQRQAPGSPRIRVTSLPAPRSEAAREDRDDQMAKQELMKLALRHKEIETQLVSTDLEIVRLKEEEGKIKAQMAHYRERVENTPLREQAMTLLMRDYLTTRDSYQNLVKKGEDAQQAENLERRQKGEQFKVTDPARTPTKPFKPNIPKILLFGVMIALGGSFGAAFIREQMDRSFQDGDDVETTLGLRVLANIPRIKAQRMAQST